MLPAAVAVLEELSFLPTYVRLPQVCAALSLRSRRVPPSPQLGSPPPPSLAVDTSFLSLILPVYPSTTLFSASRLWSSPPPPFFLRLPILRGWVGSYFSLGVPCHPSTLRYYSSADYTLLPVASAFRIPLLPSYFPCFDLSSTLGLFIVAP